MPLGGPEPGGSKTWRLLCSHKDSHDSIRQVYGSARGELEHAASEECGNPGPSSWLLRVACGQQQAGAI